MVYRQSFWLFFLSLMLIGIVGYTLHTGLQVWRYLRLDQQVEVQEIRWSILSLNEDAFIPLARYRFKVHGKSYQGQTRWQENYLNQWTAQEAITRLSSPALWVWFDSSDPEISSLQKIFPVKASVYTCILWLLGIYFFSLGYYIKRHFL